MNERVKKIRKAVNLSQREFGKRLGVQDTAISKIESGGNKVSEQMILAICREFGVNEEWLRTGAGEMFVMDMSDVFAAAAQKFNLEDFDIKILETYARLPEERREVFKGFVADLVRYVEADLVEQLEIGIYNEIGHFVTDPDEVSGMNEGVKAVFQEVYGVKEGDKDVRRVSISSRELTEEQFVELARERFRASKKGGASSMTSEKDA